MKSSLSTEEIIHRLPKGYVFTFADLGVEVKYKEAVIKHLNRLVTSGKLNKLSKGKYYKPENSSFGELPPPKNQIVKDLLEKNGKTIGYITGYGAFNELGLTTQVSNTIQIGRNEIRACFKRGIYKISFIKQKNRITKENISLLKILDSLRFIKSIPGTSIDNSCKRLAVLINALSIADKEYLVKLSIKYPPSTRALLGAILEQIKYKKLELLQKSLNPITSYKIQVSSKVLPTISNWNIK